MLIYYVEIMKFAERTTKFQGVTLAKNKVITITKRTIRFSQNVYLFHTLEGFSEEEIDIRIIPFWMITILFMIGVIISSYKLTLGWLLIMLAMGGIVVDLSQPKNYGLLLAFSSGNKILFITNDKAGIKNVISVMYDFFETETKKDFIIEISITGSSTNITLNTYHNFSGGNVFGSISAEIYDK